ncbi:hypothetical protein JKF63_02629 [Porcisia hertigi]|uniref:Uncharacterized protein n=1 Tax=Porcisia hertigi TaxID=2761500 RepID=A0A836L400_9TRYP|nr:hypothetical protein JKF63_02629 [Porcisia hertigi]
MAAPQPTLLPSDEQRSLLDQFVFHAIQEKIDAPVIWVGSGGRHEANGTTNNRVSSTASTSSTSSRSSSFSLAQSSAAADVRSNLSMNETRPDATALHDRGLAPFATSGTLDPLQRVPQEQSVCVVDSQAQALERATPPSLHVIGATPLLRGHNVALRGELASPLTSAPASSHQPSGSMRTGIASESVAPPEPLRRNSDADALDRATQMSVDEQCQVLAERLLRLSADVDAVTFAMDHRVMSPSDFC